MKGFMFLFVLLFSSLVSAEEIPVFQVGNSQKIQHEYSISQQDLKQIIITGHNSFMSSLPHQQSIIKQKQKFKLSSFILGLGINLQVRIPNIIDIAFIPRFRLMYTRVPNPVFP